MKRSALLPAFVGVASILALPTAAAEECKETLHLPTGAEVCTPPKNGGTIQIDLASPIERPAPLPVDEDGYSDLPSVETVMKLDLSLLDEISTADSIDLDFGIGDDHVPITFKRHNYDLATTLEDELAILRGGDLESWTGEDNVPVSGRKNKRKLHRRMHDMASDSFYSDILMGLDSLDGMDDLPPNPYIPPGEGLFQYFDGTSILTVDGKKVAANLHLKLFNHHRIGLYANGYAQIGADDYMIKADFENGGTYLSKLGQDEFHMPDPIELTPEEIEEAEVAQNARRLKRQSNPSPFLEQLRQIDHVVQERERRNRQLEEENYTDGSIIDLMLVYTKNALCQMNNLNNRPDSTCHDRPQSYFDDPDNHVNILNECESAVRQTNEAYVNSDVMTQLRLVYVHFTPEYNDTGISCGDSLSHLRFSDDGEMDEVHDLRDDWGADIVAMLSSSFVRGCGGIAYLGPRPPSMFSLTKVTSAARHVLAHEVGHNFGCNHDRLNARPNQGYTYGWQDPDADFRTILAYACPNGHCPRITYFSNPHKLWEGKIMGDAANDCARKHNDGIASIANYRNVRITAAPTLSSAPTISSAPSQGPSITHSLGPSQSAAPSDAPSISTEPSGMPSEFPTYDFGDLSEFHTLETPRATDLRVHKGIMFDVTAKDYEITIRNFRIPFLRGGSMNITIWSKDGPFWYEKNNQDAWDYLGSPEAYSPGVTLTDPVPLQMRGGLVEGFEPIVISAGSIKGIYITVNETSADDNLIGQIRKMPGSTCPSDFTEFFETSTWSENDDLSLSEGAYKDSWISSGHDEAVRYFGTIYYTRSETQRRRLQQSSNQGEIEGIYLIADFLMKPGANFTEDMEHRSYLEVLDGKLYQLKGVNESALDRQIFISGLTRLKIPLALFDGTAFHVQGISLEQFLAPDLETTHFTAETVDLRFDNEESSSPFETRSLGSHRALQSSIYEGVKDLLVVLVTVPDGNGGLAHPTATEAQVSDRIFGDGTDTHDNVAGQFSACSFDQLQFRKSQRREAFSSSGVISVTIPDDTGILYNSDWVDMMNAAVDVMLVDYTADAATDLADHVIFGLVNSVTDDGESPRWSGIAGVNNWHSAYMGAVLDNKVVMHELGHNINLLHSGVIEGYDGCVNSTETYSICEYGDHSCLMGNPPFSAGVPGFTGRMCFNSPKNYQLGWYEDAVQTVTPSSRYDGALKGIVNYELGTTPQDPVIIKIEVQRGVPGIAYEGDLYLGFNHAVAFNVDTSEGRNFVGVYQAQDLNQAGQARSTSKRVALLDAGHSWDNGLTNEHRIEVNVNSITMDDTEGRADVSVVYGGCTSDEECDDGFACNGQETCLTNGLCGAGTPQPDCCGNGSCDVNNHEYTFNCPVDGCPYSCGDDCKSWFNFPGTLVTQSHAIGYPLLGYGLMFTVEAHSNIIITQINGRLDFEGDTCHYKIWTRPGSYVGYEEFSFGWTNLLDKSDAISGGLNAETLLPELSSPVVMSSGETQAFYLWTNCVFRYSISTTVPVGSAFESNDELSVHGGDRILGEFGYKYENQLSISIDGAEVPILSYAPSSRLIYGTFCLSNADCDDGNACNGEETCSADGTCNPGTSLSNCCGDGVCSEGEHLFSCPQDCSSFSCTDNNECEEVTAGSNLPGNTVYSFFRGKGIMFDVQAQNDNIAITQINTRYSHTEQCDVKIWTKSGTFEGSEFNLGHWTLLLDEAGYSCSAGRSGTYPYELFDVTELPEFSPVSVASGETQAFYVWMDGPSVYGHGMMVNYMENPETGSYCLSGCPLTWGDEHPELRNDNIKAYSGREILGEFSQAYGTVPYLFNGSIKFGVFSPTTLSPSSPPSSSPTAAPTGSTNPTGEQTSEPTSSPSESPTTASPSSAPSNAPSTSAPSSSPTTTSPTSGPTSSPSVSPSTAAPTSSPTQHTITEVVEVTVSTSLEVQNITVPAETDAFCALVNVLANAYLATLLENSLDVERVIITSVNGNNADVCYDAGSSRRLVIVRALQTESAAIDADITTVVTETCTGSACDEASVGQENNEVAATVVENLTTSIEQSVSTTDGGSSQLVQAIQQQAADLGNEEVASSVENVAVVENAVTVDENSVVVEARILTSGPTTSPSSSPTTASPTTSHQTLTSSVAWQPIALDGIMFEVYAKEENIVIRDIGAIVFSSSLEFALDYVDLAIYVVPGGFYDSSTGDSVDQLSWSEAGTASVLGVSDSELISKITNGDYDPLFGDALGPIFVHQGETVGIYLTIKDPLRNHKIILLAGSSLLGNDFQDANLLVREGLRKQWNPCNNWGETSFDETLSPVPYRFIGDIIYTLEGTSEPSWRPSAEPSLSPSMSLLPTKSNTPSFPPSAKQFASLAPSISSVPSQTPSMSGAPTYDLVALITPENEFGENGNGADGIMFDIMGIKSVDMYSIELLQLNTFPMNIRIYTRIGSHYSAYDDESQWELIQSYTNFTSRDEEAPRRLSFPPQRIGPGLTRAFYVAVTETYGEPWPLMSAMMPGTNYTGEFASDDHIVIFEGIKFYGISEHRPFGQPYMHEGPGGRSFNMRQGKLWYRQVDTLEPSESPSVSQVPSLSTFPSMNPSLSSYPSMEPSESSEPTDVPTTKPSTSILPSFHPSDQPSLVPSASAAPSLEPSTSTEPSSIPSLAPSSQPSWTPSDSPSTSAVPSSTPSESPSLQPSTTQKPSIAPSESLLPTQTRYVLSSNWDVPECWNNYSWVPMYKYNCLSAAAGVMFEVVAENDITIQTFQIQENYIGGVYGWTIFTKPGGWDGFQTNADAWTKLGEATVDTSGRPYTACSLNPVSCNVLFPSQHMAPVTMYQGETRSFYIASGIVTDQGYEAASIFNVSPTSSDESNGDLIVKSGFRMYPYTNHFYTPDYRLSQDRNFLFRGDVIYTREASAPSDVPSASPSIKSSDLPSVSQSSIPSSAPSELPSLSALPSSSSGKPSLKPSTSLVPSQTPSALPSSGPSVQPTDRPVDFTPEAPMIEISIPSSISLVGFGIPQTDAEVNVIISIVGPTLQQAASANLSPNQRIKEVIITSINGNPVNFRRGLAGAPRELNAGLGIEYEIILEEICATSSCDNAQEVANQLYQSVTESMKEEIDSGAFAQALETQAVEVGETLEIAVASSDFSAAVVELLGIVSRWYPAWGNTGDYCLNDGNEPGYMRLNPGQWIESSLSKCCKRYYDWIYSECMGTVVTVATGSSRWFVNHQSSTCVQDCPEGSSVDKSCGGLAQSWNKLHDTALECCSVDLGWIGEQFCVAQSTGVSTGTNLWFVDWIKEACVQDCESSAGSNCGGVVTSSATETFETADSCCENKLGWMEKDDCVAKSTGATPSQRGSFMYYVDWALMKCVKDCEDPSDPHCKGLAEKHDTLYASANTCCSEKLYWLDPTASCVP